MLYFDINTPSALMIPRNREAFPVAATSLQVRNTTDNLELVIPVAGCVLEGDYARLVLGALPEGFHAGEWEYTLTATDREGVVTSAATGILSVTGEPATNVKQYEAETNYKQYGD